MLAETVNDLIRFHAESAPETIAISTPDGFILNYSELHDEINKAVDALNALGIGRNDCVAVVLPNGPQMAVAFLALAAAAVCAPLNPAYRASEFASYLGELAPRALLTVTGSESAAVEVAKACHIPVLEIDQFTNSACELFRPTIEAWSLVSSAASSRFGLAGIDDIALMLHTSGTTAKAKIVPLSHRNLCASAIYIRNSLALTPRDRCMNVMPLFHVHGLVAGLLSSLVAGSSVICTPGFYASQFLDWLIAARATWYTAVPTIHHSILSRAAIQPYIVERSSLRFIRSSSAPLAPHQFHELEQVFNVPVVESYGMTEAAHQIASNPLPPEVRKPGSVGMAAGTEVAVMAEDSNQLQAPNVVGEITIRGANVTTGYANNSNANAQAYCNGWFRTGDQGCLDSDGYIYLTGRFKELINRGGEKIAPREVEEALAKHPGITEVVVFAVPDKKLGECVAAAVVLTDGTQMEALDVRRYAAELLVDFKVPERVFIVEQIPKSATGKVQRIDIAEKLQLSEAMPESAITATEFLAPRNEIEVLLAEIWVDVLGLKQVGVNDHFLDLCGDSIAATRIVARILNILQLDLTLFDFFEALTIAEQAVVIEQKLLDTSYA